MSKLDLITYPCHACDDLHHAIPEDTKEQIKDLFMELAESCEENWGNGKPLIDPEVIKEKINDL